MIIGRLQGVPGNPAGASGRVWVLDGSDFPKQGRKSVGVAPAVLREAGEGGQLPGGDVPGLCQPVGTGIGGQGAVSAESWTSDKDRCEAAVCRRIGRATGPRRSWPWRWWAGTGAGPPEGWMGRGGRRLRDVAVLPGGPGGLGDVVRAGRSVRLYGVAAGACLDQCGVSGIRASPQTQAARRSAPDHGAAQRRVAGGGLA